MLFDSNYIFLSSRKVNKVQRITTPNSRNSSAFFSENEQDAEGQPPMTVKCHIFFERIYFQQYASILDY